jgi:hypothetical protein
MAELRRSAKRLRCAIYTRKSSEEGLEQAFNSLDACLRGFHSLAETRRLDCIADAL